MQVPAPHFLTYDVIMLTAVSLLVKQIIIKCKPNS